MKRAFDRNNERVAAAEKETARLAKKKCKVRLKLPVSNLEVSSSFVDVVIRKHENVYLVAKRVCVENFLEDEDLVQKIVAQLVQVCC